MKSTELDNNFETFIDRIKEASKGKALISVCKTYEVDISDYKGSDPESYAVEKFTNEHVVEVKDIANDKAIFGFQTDDGLVKYFDSIEASVDLNSDFAFLNAVRDAYEQKDDIFKAMITRKKYCDFVFECLGDEYTFYVNKKESRYEIRVDKNKVAYIYETLGEDWNYISNYISNEQHLCAEIVGYF